MLNAQGNHAGSQRATKDGKAEYCCALARLAEESGNYDDARRVLSPFYVRIGEVPRLEGLSDHLRAMVLLRAGSLAMRIGWERKIKDALDEARSLAFACFTLAQEIGDRSLACESQLLLSKCYRRNTALDEARACAEMALEYVPADDEVLLLQVRTQLAIVARLSRDYSTALDLHKLMATSLPEAPCSVALGDYFNEYAYLKNLLGEIEGREDWKSEALDLLQRATSHYVNGGNKPQTAQTANNLAFLLLDRGQFEEAHRHLDRAHEIYIELGHAQAAAEVTETRARVFIEQKAYDAAASCAQSALAVFEETESYGLIVQVLQTEGTAHARAGRTDDAVASFLRAREVALERVGSEVAAQIMVRMLDETAGNIYFDAGLTFGEAVRRIEHGMLTAAYQETGGTLKEVSLRLGFKKYQNLQYILKASHRELLENETAPTPKKRRRSIIKVKKNVSSIQRDKPTGN